MKLVSQDENWLYYEGEVCVEGEKYTVRYTQCKMNLKTNLPEHLSKQRIRWSNDPTDTCRDRAENAIDKTEEIQS